MARFYSDHVLPHLLNLAMRHKELAAYRQRIVTTAQGRVLEIGIGSGLNLPFYGAGVDAVIGLDPSASLLNMAQTRAKTAASVSMLQGTAEAIPLETASVDGCVAGIRGAGALPPFPARITQCGRRSGVPGPACG